MRVFFATHDAWKTGMLLSVIICSLLGGTKFGKTDAPNYSGMFPIHTLKLLTAPQDANGCLILA
jgi:hypothetical protein